MFVLIFENHPIPSHPWNILKLNMLIRYLNNSLEMDVEDDDLVVLDGIVNIGFDF